MWLICDFSSDQPIRKLHNKAVWLFNLRKSDHHPISVKPGTISGNLSYIYSVGRQDIKSVNYNGQMVRSLSHNRQNDLCITMIK